MNTRDKGLLLPDIQSQIDRRELRIEAVGVKDVRYPLSLGIGGVVVPVNAVLTMTVGLPAAVKGTHMSRFIELLEAQEAAIDQARFKTMLLEMLMRLDAHSGTIEMRFTYFIKKTAPVSGVQSLLDCEVCWHASVDVAGEYAFRQAVMIAATSLCPCSKEISAYGAHNQRSHITIDAELASEMDVEKLVAIAENSASCEVYGLLKRVDEKYVTERAYDNPKFVEDLVRDVALGLQREACVKSFSVEVENFESIHNHSAYARIVNTGRV